MWGSRFALLAGLVGGMLFISPALAEDCPYGLVWRSAAAGDRICVTAQSRERARQDNAAAASRRAPSQKYGPMACKQGFVWRSAFQGDMVCVTPQVRTETRRENAAAAERAAQKKSSPLNKKNVSSYQRPAPDSCKQGYVWRSAAAGDKVCVTPASRQRAAQENAAAASRRAPSAAFGPMACKQGFVWRSAFQGDMVCVAPNIRDVVKRENAAAASNRVGG